MPHRLELPPCAQRRGGRSFRFVLADQSTLTRTSTPPGLLTTADGSVVAIGDGADLDGMNGQRLNAPVVGISGGSVNGSLGYWLASADGGVFSFGTASFFGSMAGQPLTAPVVGIAATPSGRGYWLVAADGGVFAFGDARFFGSMGGQTLNSRVVGITVSPDGAGYSLVAADGGVFTFGDARFFGSMGGQHLNAPVVAMVATDGNDDIPCRVGRRRVRVRGCTVHVVRNGHRRFARYCDHRSEFQHDGTRLGGTTGMTASGTTYFLTAAVIASYRDKSRSGAIPAKWATPGPDRQTQNLRRTMLSA